MARIYSNRGASDEEKHIFAERLNYYIAMSGKTQAQVAKELGFNSTTLNMWCKGKSMPTSGKIQKIADYFRVGKSDLTERKYHIDDDTNLFFDPFNPSTKEGAAFGKPITLKKLKEKYNYLDKKDVEYLLTDSLFRYCAYLSPETDMVKAGMIINLLMEQIKLTCKHLLDCSEKLED